MRDDNLQGWRSSWSQTSQLLQRKHDGPEKQRKVEENICL